MFQADDKAELIELLEARTSSSLDQISFTDSDPILIIDRKRGAQEPFIGIYNPSTNSWLDLGKMPSHKSNYAVASTKDKIFIVGGRDRWDWLNTLEVYDKDTDRRRDVSCQ